MRRFSAISSWGLGVVLLLAAVVPARGDSRPLYKCRQKITAESEGYVLRRRDYLNRCGERMLECELGLERKNYDPTNCRFLAQGACTRNLSSDPQIGNLGKAIVRHHDYIVRYCGLVDFASIIGTGSGALWHGNDADCGTAADLDSLIACIRSHLDESVDAGFGDIFPRLGLLLDSAGVGGGFPDIPRPTITDVSVAATAADSGTLVPPGTIAITAGNAVRFLGDAATLPCGGGSNGDVTVTILTLGAACSDSGAVREQFALHEPYGADRGGMAGPFSADATYCLALEDGSCSDTVTGTIDVP